MVGAGVRVAPSTAVGAVIGRRTVGGRAIAAGVAIVVDRLVGEPPIRPHPVSLFGRAMRAVERRAVRGPDWRRARSTRRSGSSIGVATGALVRSTTVATYLAVAGRALDDAAADVDEALAAGDLDRARTLLPALVGRDPSELDEKEIARAVVESVAENTVDAVVSPALWAVVAGAPGALGYRAVNTMDAMVGYRSDALRAVRHGQRPARRPRQRRPGPAHRRPGGGGPPRRGR